MLEGDSKRRERVKDHQLDGSAVERTRFPRLVGEVERWCIVHVVFPMAPDLSPSSPPLLSLFSSFSSAHLLIFSFPRPILLPHPHLLSSRQEPVHTTSAPSPPGC